MAQLFVVNLKELNPEVKRASPDDRLAGGPQTQAIIDSILAHYARAIGDIPPRVKICSVFPVRARGHTLSCLSTWLRGRCAMPATVPALADLGAPST
jgi:hypothetical protein